jgi:hypothetical protein
MTVQAVPHTTPRALHKVREMVLTVCHPVSYILCAVNIYRQCVVWPEIFFTGRTQKSEGLQGGAHGIRLPELSKRFQSFPGRAKLMEKQPSKDRFPRPGTFSLANASFWRLKCVVLSY